MGPISKAPGRVRAALEAWWTAGWRVVVAAAAAFGRLDLQDVHIYGGIGVAAWGGAMISTAWTLVAVGVALVALGLVAPLLRPKGD